MSKQAEMPNAHESHGQDMQQETPKELIGTHGQQPLLIMMRRVTPPKGDFALV
jgi:hypothetical protein